MPQVRRSCRTSKGYSLLQVVAVDQSIALQVETLVTSLATGGLQEQIESGDRSIETADTQQVAEDAHLLQVRRSCGTSKGYFLLQKFVSKGVGGDDTDAT